MIRHTVTVMGKEVAYWERNPEWPQTIVMLHGFRGNHKGLSDMVQHLDGFRLILPDLPGYGESKPLDVPHTLMNYAAWLDEFVRDIGLKNYVSWSHSYGGAIALIQAAQGKHRPYALIAVSPAVPHRSLSNDLIAFIYLALKWLPLKLRHQFVASRTLDRISARLLIKSVSERRRRELTQRGENNLELLNANVVIENYLSAFDTQLEMYAARIEMPTLIVAGVRDSIVSPRRLQHLESLLKNGSLTVLRDQGHLAPLERPATVATITKQFIGGL